MLHWYPVYAKPNGPSAEPYYSVSHGLHVLIISLLAPSDLSRKEGSGKSFREWLRFAKPLPCLHGRGPRAMQRCRAMSTRARDGTVAPVAVGGVDRNPRSPTSARPLGPRFGGAIGLGRNGRNFGPFSCDAGRSVTSC
jgi:hypothetical protein